MLKKITLGLAADVNVAISHRESLARQIPQAQLKVIEGADHMMPFSHANEVEATIETFISRIIFGVQRLANAVRQKKLSAFWVC